VAQAEKSDPFVCNESPVEISDETWTAITHGIQASDEGRITPSERVPELVRQWISKLSTQNQR